MAKLSKKIVEGPPNQWVPVTEQYAGALDSAAVNRLLDDDQVRADVLARLKSERAVKAPAGVVAVTWYFFLRAVAYVFFASMLLSDPNTPVSIWLHSHIQCLVPLAVSQIKADTRGELFVGGLVFYAIVMVMIGLLWMFRFARIRIITLCFVGATLLVNIIHLISNQIAGSATLSATEQKDALILSSAVEVAIFLYVAISRNIAKSLESAT